MKLSTKLTLGVIALIALANAPAFAQNAGAAAGAQSQAAANVAVGSQSGAQAVLINTAPASTTANTTSHTTLDNVPAVSAPSVFGGGHPCLAGKSGGIAVAGFGGSYGEGSPEPVCMLWYMGQPEAAIRMLVMTDSRACQALGNVGYYRVGKSVVPFACGETVKGGVDTPGFASRVTKVSTRNAPESSIRPKARPNGLSRCEKIDGKVHIGYKYGADKTAAKATCLAALGY